jgi:hypothetical protein
MRERVPSTLSERTLLGAALQIEKAQFRSRALSMATIPQLRISRLAHNAHAGVDPRRAQTSGQASEGGPGFYRRGRPSAHRVLPSVGHELNAGPTLWALQCLWLRELRAAPPTLRLWR